VTSTPYDRQGMPLETSLGVNGWWVEYGYVFLFAPPPNQRFTQLKLPTGESCFGFNVADLADAFAAAGPLPMSPSDLLLNNQIGSLSFREEPGTLTPPRYRCCGFHFQAAVRRRSPRTRQERSHCRFRVTPAGERKSLHTMSVHHL
jgi:hypothetical protein